MTSEIDLHIRQLKLSALHRCRERIEGAKSQPAGRMREQNLYTESCGLTVQLKRMRGL